MPFLGHINALMCIIYTENKPNNGWEAGVGRSGGDRNEPRQRADLDALLACGGPPALHDGLHQGLVGREPVGPQLADRRHEVDGVELGVRLVGLLERGGAPQQLRQLGLRLRGVRQGVAQRLPQRRLDDVQEPEEVVRVVHAADLQEVPDAVEGVAVEELGERLPVGRGELGGRLAAGELGQCVLQLDGQHHQPRALLVGALQEGVGAAQGREQVEQLEDGHGHLHLFAWGHRYGIRHISANTSNPLDGFSTNNAPQQAANTHNKQL
eukprot:scaffold336631_cov34-Prasinocladus_malaysianus.AAC.1